MNDDERGLIATICDTPGDDVPRLVYADWLEDTCNPPQPKRAEFIRLQCGIASTLADGQTPTSAQLARERELLDAHRFDWLPLEELASNHWCFFDRGFPVRWPVESEPVGVEFPEIAGCPEYTGQNVPERFAGEVARSMEELTPHSRCLILGNTATNDDLSILGGHEHAHQLRCLNLRWAVNITNLAPLKDLTQLKSLDLSYSTVSDISALEGLTQLKSLVLWRTQISDISALEGLTQLESLDLSHTPVSDEQLQNLCRSHIGSALPQGQELHITLPNGMPTTLNALRAFYDIPAPTPDSDIMADSVQPDHGRGAGGPNPPSR